MKQIHKRLTYANVVSSLALFLVLGGATAVATGHLGRNTVGSKQLKRNAVTRAKIKKNAVTGAKTKERTLGKVPSAAHADKASKADLATSAASAVHAGTAGKAGKASQADVATSAASADDAAQLGGLPADAFQLAGQVDTGIGGYEAGDPSTVLLAWPALGAELATDGDGDGARDLLLRSTITNAPAFDVCFAYLNVNGCVLNGGEQDVGFGTQTEGAIVIYRSSDPGVHMLVQCKFAFGPDDVICAGIRSRAGG